MLDASAFVGVWAFRAYPERTVEHVVEALRARGFRGACLSPVEAVLHPEPMSANRSFVSEVSAASISNFVTVLAPVVDPSHTPWEEHLGASLELGGERVGAIKLFPNYHAYSLDEPAVDALADRLKARNLTLSLQVRMEDERSRHPMMSTMGVPVAEIDALASRHPDLQILVCGAYMGELRQLVSKENLHFEMSFVESGRLLGDALKHVGATRLLSGTHTPLFMPGVGAIKALADQTDAETLKMITEGNFRRLFNVSG